MNLQRVAAGPHDGDVEHPFIQNTGVFVRVVRRPSLQGADEIAHLEVVLALAVVGCEEVGAIHELVGVVHDAIRISDRSRKLLTWLSLSYMSKCFFFFIGFTQKTKHT